MKILTLEQILKEDVNSFVSWGMEYFEEYFGKASEEHSNRFKFKNIQY